MKVKGMLGMVVGQGAERARICRELRLKRQNHHTGQ